MRRLLIAILAVGSAALFVASSEAPAAGRTAAPSPLKRDLAELVAFAQHNLNLDPRASALTPRQRQQALVESLMLYGIRFPEPERLRPDMTADEIADVLLRTLSMKDRASLASVAHVFLSGLRGTQVFAKPFTATRPSSRLMSNQG